MGDGRTNPNHPPGSGPGPGEPGLPDLTLVRFGGIQLRSEIPEGRQDPLLIPLVPASPPEGKALLGASGSDLTLVRLNTHLQTPKELHDSIPASFELAHSLLTPRIEEDV
eukprot:15477518-Alexandrium_andersonii.AAC.1